MSASPAKLLHAAQNACGDHAVAATARADFKTAREWQALAAECGRLLRDAVAASARLFEYRIYVRAANLEWQPWETVDANTNPRTRLYRAQQQHPDLVLRLARRTTVEEWVSPSGKERGE